VLLKNAGAILHLGSCSAHWAGCRRLAEEERTEAPNLHEKCALIVQTLPRARTPPPFFSMRMQ
jgi:hypothetical protein